MRVHISGASIGGELSDGPFGPEIEGVRAIFGSTRGSIKC